MNYNIFIGYKQQKHKLVDNMIGLSKKGRKNNYPVILVHGTLGFVNDQNAFVRSYWSKSFTVLSK